jgi:hypothetical protein
MSVPGWAQQISTCPSPGGSSGVGLSVTPPDGGEMVQVWQAPVRQFERPWGQPDILDRTARRPS